MSISVLPRPRRVSERAGRFQFAASMPIVLSIHADEAERFAATVLAEAVAGCGGAIVEIERHGKPTGLSQPNVQMFLFGRDDKLIPAVRKLAPKQDIGGEGYVIDVASDRVLVGANSAAGLFYASQTLVQMLHHRVPASRESSRTRGNKLTIPCCRIVDWPQFRYRGFMLDVSRFRVPTTETLVRLIHRLAACKVNVLQLYVEHTFRSRRHPGYSEGCSPLTAEQLSDLDELCAMLHIELQANQNSLGHLQHMLSQPGFERYAERPAETGPVVDKKGNKRSVPWSLRLDDPAVYDFLDDIYSEHLAAIRSPLVNLGCDEVYDMGAGRSSRLVARKGWVRAFVDHVRKIAAVAARYGKQAMIWDDMVRSNPKVLGMLPESVIPVFWSYNQGPDDRYWKIWGNSGRRHWVAPGCSGWQSIFARIDKAWDNIHWVTDFARRGGAEGVLNTEWGDYGNFQPLGVSYYSIAIGAELSWNSQPMTDKSDFARRFASAVFADPTGRMGALYRTLGQTNHVFADQPYQSRPWLVYWDEFPAGSHLAGIDVEEMEKSAALAAEGIKLAEQLRADPAIDCEDSLFEELILAGSQTILAARKARLAQKIRAALEPRAAARGHVPTGMKLPPSLKRELKKFLADWDAQKSEFRRVWLLNNEPSQIDYRLKLYAARRRELVKLLK